MLSDKSERPLDRLRDLAASCYDLERTFFPDTVKIQRKTWILYRLIEWIISYVDT